MDITHLDPNEIVEKSNNAIVSEDVLHTSITIICLVSVNHVSDRIYEMFECLFASGTLKEM